jgi:hypothetical protein
MIRFRQRERSKKSEPGIDLKIREVGLLSATAASAGPPQPLPLPLPFPVSCLSMFHVEQSIEAKRTAMRTPGTTHHNRALDARERGQGEMAYPENEVRPLVCGDALAYPFNHPFFEMKAECFICQELDTHLII